MMNLGFRRLLGCAMTLATVAGAAVAGSSFGDDQTLFELRSNNNDGVGSFAVTSSQVQTDPATGELTWKLTSPVTLENGSRLVDAQFTFGGPTTRGPGVPVLSLTFSVQAGAFPTDFAIASGLLPFATINPAQGIASAGITATDVNATPGNQGATLTGLGPGGNAYSTYYNGFLGAGTLFQGFIPSVIAPPNFGNSESDGAGPLAMGAVSDISAEFRFRLTPGDTASGTSNYLVIPEPTTLSLLAIGALTLFRRR